MALKDSFAEERALISAYAQVPVGGKLQLLWRNWKVIKGYKRVVNCALALLRTSCPPKRILHYLPGTPKHEALTDMI